MRKRNDMSNEDTLYPSVEPVSVGIKARCPRCGQGNLFNGYLKLAKRCETCDLDYGFADSGDGPVVFVLLLDGFIVTGLALWAEVSFQFPLWLHFIIWIPLAILLGLIMTRWMKGILIALQYKHKAFSGQRDKRGLNDNS